MTGIELIANERKEQIKKHKHSIKNDADRNKLGELAYHAAVLATPRVLWIGDKYANEMTFIKAKPDEGWTVPNMTYKTGSIIMVDNSELIKNGHKGERIKQLIVAGALIAAEIDRLQFKD